MKILITGANGLLGQHLIKELLDKPYTVIASSKGPSRLPFPETATYSYHELDITDGPHVNNFIHRLHPDVIIHAAAMTQVEDCEENKIDCWTVNVTATRFLVDAAKETGCRFIFISTDFVFDGLHGPYGEDAMPNPVNYYGSSKWAAEKAVQESGLPWTIIRTVLVTANMLQGTRYNLVAWIKEKLENGEPVKMVDDQYRTPTFIDDLVQGVLLIMEKNAKGIFHISGKDSLTPYAIALEIARLLKLNEGLVQKAVSADFPDAPMRPPSTNFNISKAERELGYSPHSFTEGLQKLFGRG